jgi:transposase
LIGAPPPPRESVAKLKAHCGPEQAMGYRELWEMSYERYADYNQQWMFPPTLEQLLPSDHTARMIREFVDAQDLEKQGFKTRKGEEGRPNYSANMLLKVWLYGYVTKIRTTRPLERACMNDIGMLWLTGMQRPDHTSLWRFWRDNRKPLKQVFKRLLEIAVDLNFVGMVLQAIDGTKIVSQASEEQGLHRRSLEKILKRLDEGISEIMKQTDQAAKHGPDCRLPEGLQQRQQLREKIQAQLKRLDEQGQDHLQPQDEDARVMKCRGGKKFAYNAQAVVEGQNQLIVAADVVTDESDNYQLVRMIDQVQENLGKAAQETVADGGYFATTELAAAENKHYSVLVNLPKSVQGSDDEPYHASRFVHDAAKDECICPRGERLRFDVVKPRDKVNPYDVRVYRCASYETCPVRWQCSRSKTGRTVQIHPNHASLVRQREKRRDEKMRALLKQRGSTVEPVFGWIKEGMNFRRWTVRGLDKVQTQWLLVCTALNLIRLKKYWIEGTLVFA